jgi:hypothetical protein
MAQHMYQYAFAASATVTIWGRIASIVLENLLFSDMPPVTDAEAAGGVFVHAQDQPLSPAWY